MGYKTSKDPDTCRSFIHCTWQSSNEIQVSFTKRYVLQAHSEVLTKFERDLNKVNDVNREDDKVLPG